MRRKKIMLKSISDNAIFERNVWLKNEKANSCFHKSFKRKLHKFSDENKENTVSAPKRKFLDFDSDFDINSKKEHVNINHFFQNINLNIKLIYSIISNIKKSLNMKKIYLSN